MKTTSVSWYALILGLGLGCSGFLVPVYGQGGYVDVQGPPVVGNGFTNGAGATLGRLFVRVGGVDADAEPGAPTIPLEFNLTSSQLRVEPTTCASAADSRCDPSGVGKAGVMGYPTGTSTAFMFLRLAGAVYLPYDQPPRVAGSSLELALEGGLNIGIGAQPGDRFRLRLAVADPEKLRRWGGEVIQGNRPYDVGTGCALLYQDALAFRFPGVIEGVVQMNDGDAIVLECETATWVASQDVPGRTVTLEPDGDAARAAGLREGVFCLLHINYSGLPRLSRVFPDAVADDVEIVQTTVEAGPVFARGDCNGDGDSTSGLSDAVFLLSFNFSADAARPPCLAACDADADGDVEGQVTDALFLLNHAFASGAAPPAPFPYCGLEPEGLASIALGCDEVPACPERS